MTNSAVSWIKNNKFVTILAIVVIYSLASGRIGPIYPSYYQSQMMGQGKMMPMGFAPQTFEAATPQIGVKDRKVITESTLSFVVSSVQNTIEKISQLAISKGGYAVNTNIRTPEETSTGNITIRIPLEARMDVLDELRKMALKVVSENISGYDVTDEYVDIQKRLNILESSKAKLDALILKVTTADEILKIQEAIFRMQDQIDSLKGRLEYLNVTSKTSLITVYLSTDEFELPYVPIEKWRPEVTFKLAVRSLIQTFKTFGNASIWIVVYSIIIIPIVILIKTFTSRLRRPQL